MVGQGTASNDLGGFDSPVLRLDPAMRQLYTDRLGIHPADVNFTPHFPTTAILAREMYRRRSGHVVDGVVATDPVALAYLLRATGPVPLPSGVVCFHIRFIASYSRTVLAFSGTDAWSQLMADGRSRPSAVQTMLLAAS